MTRQLAIASALAAARRSARPDASGDEQLGSIGKIGGAVKRASRSATSRSPTPKSSSSAPRSARRIRTRYGVVQDADVHRYVALVGGALAAGQHASPTLPWTFIVLDTDARQRLCRAGRLRPHHARRAGADPGRSGAGRRARPRDHPRHREAHDPRDSEEQDHPDGRRRNAVRQRRAARTASPTRLPRHRREGLRPRAKRTRATRRAWRWPTASATRRRACSAFLTRLQERNKDAKEKRGLFASHPEMKERLDRLTKQISRAEAGGHRDRSPIATARTSPTSRCRRRRSPTVEAGVGGTDRRRRRSRPRRSRRAEERRSRRRRAAASASAGCCRPVAARRSRRR